MLQRIETMILLLPHEENLLHPMYLITKHGLIQVAVFYNRKGELVDLHVNSDFELKE